MRKGVRREAAVLSVIFLGSILGTTLLPGAVALSAFFAPPHSESGLDIDGDGLFNYLVVDARVDVTEAGTFRISAFLHNLNFTFVVETSNQTPLDVGLHTVPLWFDGVAINVSGVDGPYTVDLSLNALPSFTFLDADTHTTAPYSHLAFDGAPARFSPPHADVGLDTNGDGLFDQLVVNASIDVTETGTFRISAFLHDPTFTLALSTSNETPLGMGLQIFPLWFDGSSINVSGIDGPYAVDLRLIDSATSTVLDTDTHTTSAYSHLAFEPPPFFLAGPHADFGLDTDADGGFNYLIVEASVQVDKAGTFLVEAVLHDPMFALTLLASNVTALTAGLHPVPLWFYGPAINASGIDGPYTVDLELRDGDTFRLLDEDTHLTAPHAALDFDGPPPTFAPPHADSGLDTDGDGLFNYLVVSVRINMTEAGSLLVEAVLHDPNFTFALSTSNTTTLDAGLGSVFLRFEGRSLNASGVDGPYVVELNLVDSLTSTPVDAGTHTTGAYSHMDFEPPVAVLTPPHADRGLDTDGDGSFNRLVVDVTVQVDQGGAYRISADLHDPAFVVRLFTANLTTLDVGVRTVTLSFDGVALHLAGVDGPYVVELNLNAAPVLTFLGADSHLTAPYSHLDFDDPPALLAPPHSDAGLDTDGDGLFDDLVVSVKVFVAEAGTFQLEAVLTDPTSTLTLSASNLTALDVGLWTVPLRFHGPAIRVSGVDGPYRVGLGLTDAATSTMLDADVHTTAAYSHLGFDSPPAILVPPHADIGVDTDGDTLSNYLVVEVSLNVTEAGTFLVRGILLSPGTLLFLFASNVTPLDVGLHTVPLWFYGPLIHAEGVDGPYTVRISIDDSRNMVRLDADVHTTFPYSHSSFDGPGLAFAPPHGDAGVDLDGDTLFDYLVVDVSLNVTEPGTYTVMAILFPAFARPFATFNVTTLEAGLQTVPLWFYGPALGMAGGDGPHRVELRLFDSLTRTPFAFDLTTTTPHFAREFAGPESLVSSPATTTPVIDGALSAGEWSDASLVDLSSVPGNQVPGFLMVKHDDNAIYVAYDAIGDTTQDVADSASIAFDTENDGIGSDGREDQFVQGGTSGDQAHYIFRFYGWSLEESPYSPSLPRHEGLASVSGFGSSDRSATDHRIYEFSIPLALLGAASGDTLGFIGGSFGPPALFDASAEALSIWPALTFPLPLAAYPDLILRDAVPPTITVLSPPSGGFAATNDVTVTWAANDAGSGLDRVEVSLDGGAPVVLPATASTHTFTGLADGPHVIAIRAFDVVGNLREVSTTVTVDTVAPTVAITSPAPGAILTSRRIDVVWAGEDATSGIDRFELRIDGEAPATLPATAANHVFSAVADGAHTVVVSAFDRAGNSAEVSVDLTVDTALLSITGPLGAGPLIGLVAGIAATGLVGLLYLLRRRGFRFRRKAR